MAGFLRRYTNVLSMIDMISKREIALLPTTGWVDRNDRRAIEIYKRKAGFASVVGLCLTETSETFHHWQIFAGGDSGVSIEFDKDAFIGLFANRPGFRCGSIRYMKLSEIRSSRELTVDDIPFVKRHGFAAEKEFRVIGMTKSETEVQTVPFDLSIIRKITFSPFIHATLARSVIDLMCRDEDCKSFRWGQSRLIENESWLAKIDAL